MSYESGYECVKKNETHLHFPPLPLPLHHRHPSHPLHLPLLPLLPPPLHRHHQV